MIRLEKLVALLMNAIEDINHGFVFDDFDSRYTKRREDAERSCSRKYWTNKVNIGFCTDESDGGEENVHALEDNGVGVERILAAFEDDQWLRRYRRARQLVYRKCPQTLPTFYAIIRNGEDRQASIRQLMKRSRTNKARSWWAAKRAYFYHRDRLESLFISFLSR